MPDELEEEDVNRSVSKESLEVPHGAIAQNEETTDLRIQRKICELHVDRSDEM